MTTYADPSRCPDCRSTLPEAPQSCPHCALPLTGPGAVELFTTLQRADQLLVALRRELSVAPAPKPGAVAATSTQDSASRRDDRGTPRVSGASVPKILLTLGALCLLVAAVTFLAVAWSWLGVGGRTVVLLVLTSASLAAAGAVGRRGLRMAGEALTVVGLGLVALDVVGARHAGWLGDLDDSGLVTTVGALVATVALLMLLLSLPRPFVSPALVAPLAVLVAGSGVQWSADSPAPMLITVLLLLCLGRVGVTLPSTWLWGSALIAGTLGWLYVLASGLSAATTDQTMEHVWGHAAVWPLLAAAAVAAVAAPTMGLGRRPTLAGCSISALVVTLVVVLPALDNSLTDATLSLLPCVLVWTGAAAVGPVRLRAAAILPLAGAAVLPAAVVLDLAGNALLATLGVGEPFTQPFGVHVAESSPWVSPWLAGPTLVTLAAAGCAMLGLASPLRRAAWVLAIAGAALVGAVVTLPLFDVRLLVIVSVLLVTACAGFAVAERLAERTAHAARIVAAAPGLLAVAAALPNDVMTTLVLAVAAAISLCLMNRADVTSQIASVAFTVAFGGLVWAAANALSIPEVYRALPILLVLGGLAIWRPQPVLESSAAVVGAVASLGAIASASDVAWALALHLTVAGALVTASSLINPTRRALAWFGGLLLAGATWVRLYDLGVTVPEAYTLPTAVVLTGVGVWRVLRDDSDDATMRALAPGLALATVPSLLAAVNDPLSVRALLLGVACLVLVLAGVALRWSAPLVIGSVVGAALVLRELTPYAADLPPWVVIGVSGTLLLVVGVTWESRMRDAGTATRYLASLR